jgi:two-component system alkaline phosphatase synthesis response regulator PhoP
MKKILLVDDDIALSEALSIILTSQGYEVRTLDRGIGVINEMEGFQPDLLILDYFLPDTDGISIAKSVKAIEIYNPLPIILISANYSLDNRAREAGINMFLPKPFNIAEFLEALEKSL